MTGTERAGHAGVEILEWCRLRVSEIDVSVSELHGEVGRHVVGKARMERPGEIPRPGRARETARGIDHVGVAEVVNLRVRRADAEADERRKRSPCTEIE